MDLLREINKRFSAESSRLLEKLYDVAYGATVGLAKVYRDKALALAKVSATTAYLETIRILRRHAQLLFIAVFAAIMLAVTVVIVPIAIVVVSDWSIPVKVYSVTALGIIDLLVIALAVHYVFSEEKWMKRTGLKTLLDSLDLSKK